MRKPDFNESAVIGYASYMFFTLLIGGEWMFRAIQNNPESMYAAYLDFLGSQTNLAVFSLAVALVTIFILFVENYIFRIVVNLIGLVYFTILAASYVFSYPNLGLGLALIFVLMMVANINRLIDEQQEDRKRKIMCDSYKKEGDKE